MEFSIMIRRLFFTAALLMPGLAYGQNPSANLSVQVVPPNNNSIACDIGPSYIGSMPAQATQAGFTHCAANYDFTQTQSFTDSVGTHQWSNLSSWFTCGRTPPFLFTRADFSDVPCDTAHVNVISDGGTQVLALSYYLTDKNNNGYSNSLDTASVNGTTVVGTSFPSEIYIEQVIRVNSNNTCSSSCLAYSLATFAPNFNLNNPCFVSGDFDEMSGFAGDTLDNTGLHLWNPTCGVSGGVFGPSPPVESPQATSSYSTYGSLMTADNVSNFTLCSNSGSGAVGGLPASAFKSCTSPFTVVPPSTAPVFLARQMVQLWEGPESAGQGGSVWTGTQHTTYIQRVTVWVCPNPTGGSDWTTGQCYNNPVITTHP
jgi:hypothetical protein